jgi:hypothetical protein
MNAPENNLIAIQVHKEITTLYKEFLEIIEDLKLNNPSITNEQYEHVRKRVLDKGNDKIRNLLYFLDFFDFIINKDKVEEAAKQKRVVVKKVIISSPVEIE